MTVTPRAGLKTLHHRSDWNTSRLKFLFKRETRTVSESDEVITAFRDGMVTLRKNRREDGFTFAEQEIGYQGIEPDDLVIHAMDGFAGAIGVSDSRGKGSPVLTIATPISDAYPKYWGYYLRSLANSGFIQSLAKGIRERSTDFRWKDASNLLVNYPDLDTQRRIADFLDRETARIDLLIEKKQRLVEVMGERQNTLIESTLAEIDPDETFRLKFVIHRIEQGWSPQCEDRRVEGNAWGVLKLGAITTGVYLEGKHKGLPTNIAPIPALRVEAGDVLVARASGSPHLVGKAAFVENTSLNLMLSDKHFRLKPVPDKVRSEYLALVINSKKSRNQIEMRLSSAGGMARNIGQGVIYGLVCPFPSLRKQDNILEGIRSLKQKTSALVASTSDSITHLKEYRSALITAAVTGQIDVETSAGSGNTGRRIGTIEQEANA